MPHWIQHDGIRILELPHDIRPGSQVHSQCLEWLVKAGRESVRTVIDLTQVRSIDGGLLAMLVRTWKYLGARPGDIVLVASPGQREVFHLTRLNLLFTLAETRSEAVHAPWPEPTPVVRLSLTRAAG